LPYEEVSERARDLTSSQVVDAFEWVEFTSAEASTDPKTLASIKVTNSTAKPFAPTGPIT
jgi:hypothetical protein